MDGPKTSVASLADDADWECVAILATSPLIRDSKLRG
jgi:hypothetical protein